MARAVWKGPFVEESLMKKVDKYKEDPKKYLSKHGQENQLYCLILLVLVFKFITEKNLFQLPYLKIWLDISLVSLRQLELFMDIHQQIKKLNQQQRLKNNYE